MSEDFVYGFLGCEFGVREETFSTFYCEFRAVEVDGFASGEEVYIYLLCFFTAALKVVTTVIGTCLGVRYVLSQYASFSFFGYIDWFWIAWFPNRITVCSPRLFFSCIYSLVGWRIASNCLASQCVRRERSFRPFTSTGNGRRSGTRA